MGCLRPGDTLEQLDAVLADRAVLLSRAQTTSEQLRRWLVDDVDGLSEDEVMVRAMRRVVGAQA